MNALALTEEGYFALMPAAVRRPAAFPRPAARSVPDAMQIVRDRSGLIIPVGRRLRHAVLDGLDAVTIGFPSAGIGTSVTPGNEHCLSPRAEKGTSPQELASLLYRNGLHERVER
jgi:hypothetical protein